MAKFEGKKCDECGNVYAADVMTVKTIRFEGPNIDDEVKKDLCDKCVDEDQDLNDARDEDTLKPVRRRKRGESSEPEEPGKVGGQPETPATASTASR